MDAILETAGAALTHRAGQATPAAIIALLTAVFAVRSWQARRRVPPLHRPRPTAAVLLTAATAVVLPAVWPLTGLPALATALAAVALMLAATVHERRVTAAVARRVRLAAADRHAGVRHPHPCTIEHCWYCCECPACDRERARTVATPGKDRQP